MRKAQTKGKKSVHNTLLKEEDLQTLYTKEILLKRYGKKIGVNNSKAN